MDTSRRDHVRELLAEVQSVPPEERAEFLREQCDDPALRAEVASLLEAQEEAAGFYEALADSVVAPMLRELDTSDVDGPHPDESDPLGLEGEKVGNYAVEEHLGGGGMGLVYRARDTDLGRTVALKFLPPHLAGTEEAEERFSREARAAAALEHANVGTVHEIGRTGEGRRYIVMTYYEGETLKEKLGREGPLPVEEALEYAAQIGEALVRAHEAGIVHRDVKPANVMITERGTVKLVDFGLARLAESPRLTGTGQQLGTVGYMSPEQVEGREVGPAADLWALGAVLYEMLTGERPFEGERRAAVLHAVLNETPTPVREHRPEVPTALARVAHRCLQKDPAERYESATALAEDLRGVRSEVRSADGPQVVGHDEASAEGPLSWLRWFFRELRRRRVTRVAVVYAGTGFVIVQLGEILGDLIGVPGWTLRMITFLLVIGFPLAVGLAWTFDVTDEGLVRSRPRAPGVEGTASNGKPFTSDGLIVALLAVAIGLFLYPRVFPVEEGPASPGGAASDVDQRRDRLREERASGLEKTPRVAVLPFENIARDTSDAFFAEGMHEEVLNQLSKVSGLAVISRTSVMGYANTDKRVSEISRELGGVEALLEGTVRRAAGQVRITIQLIDASEDEHLWSNTYERGLSPQAVFDIQADIAEQIASALEAELTKGERRRIEDAPTEDLAAYDAYLKGRSALLRAWSTRNPSDIDQVIRRLREAVRRDSTFAEARGVLSQAYVLRSRVSGKSQWLDSAQAEVDRALAHEPDLPEALQAQAQIYRRDSIQAAEEIYHRILELEPSNVLAIEGLNDVAQERGNPVERVRWSHRAVQLEPRAPFYMGTMGSALSSAGMWKPASAWFRRAIDLGPDRPADYHYFGLAFSEASQKPRRGLRVMESFLDDHPNHPRALSLASFLAFLAGQPEQTKSYLERFPEAQRKFYPEGSPSRPNRLGLGTVERTWLGLAELRLGQQERGRQLLGRAVDSLQIQLEQGAETPDRAQIVFLAGAQSALGKRKKALQRLEEGLERTAPEIPTLILLSGPQFDELRSEPRFQQVVRRIEARRETVHKEIRQLGIDLYPPGAKPNPDRAHPQTDA